MQFLVFFFLVIKHLYNFVYSSERTQFAISSCVSFATKAHFAIASLVPCAKEVPSMIFAFFLLLSKNSAILQFLVMLILLRQPPLRCLVL